MALNVVLQLADSEGLMKVVVLTGLSHPVVIRPAVMGEPLLMAQAFYYLEELPSVAQIRFESGQHALSEEEMEYLIDNYLFEYSKTDPHARMSFKVGRPAFWRDDPEEFYALADHRHTEALALDQLNDPSVHAVRAVDPNDGIDLNDWQIGRNYVLALLETYIESLAPVLTKKVIATVGPSDTRDGYRDGYFGTLRVLRPDHGLIDYFQAVALENIAFRAIPPAAVSVPLAAPRCAHTLDALPVERVIATKQYAPVLLSHYFSGLKEVNPLKSYVGFYNVLEYYFEEAPALLGRAVRVRLGHGDGWVWAS